MSKKLDSDSKILIFFWSIFSFIVVVIFFTFFLIKIGAIGYLPPIEELQNPKNKYASEIYSSDMSMLGSYFYSKENRINVTYNELSPNIVNALVATEDARFLKHSGIDGRALFRSVIMRGIFHMKNAGGGSTITQQLAKQLYSDPSKNVFQRMLQKPNEWVIAVELERLYTKEEILAMYLNKFDFLNNAVGVKSAAQIYFSKLPSNLKIEEAATLIGMCKNPSYFNPVRFKERTRGRRNVVLSQMEKSDFITKAERDSLQALPLVLRYQKVDHKLGLATYFREFLRQMMMAKEPDKSNYASWQGQKYSDDSLQWATNPLYGWCNKNKKPNGDNYNLYTDGLKIYTTIDSHMQRYAEEAVREHLGNFLQPKFFQEKKGKSYAPYSKEISTEDVNAMLNRSMKQSERYLKLKAEGLTDASIENIFKTKVSMNVFSWKDGVLDTIMSPLDSIRYQKHFLRCGFMSMNPHNGHVKAYIGGPDYTFFQYDMVTSGRRQVGSTIKPFLYTLGMEEGLSPCDKVPNVPQTFTLPDGSTWTPKNASKARMGEMVTLRWGLANSNNWISASVIKQFTPQALVKLMRSFGIRSKLDPVVSLALGPCEISVGEMVSAYTAFANKGIRVNPLFVTRIEDNSGNVVANFVPETNEVFSEETSYKMLSMLSAVIDEGTGTRIRYRYKLRGAIGGKTGTTQNNSDGWFMGFTPNLVSGCWVGGEDRSIHFDNMGDGQGATMALPIWGLYMQKVFADKELGYSEDESFGVPKNYDACKSSSTAPDNSLELYGDY
jgi:penicillin-binding protein 1A